MDHRRADGLAGQCVPHPRRMIAAAGEHRLAVRPEGDRDNRLIMEKNVPGLHEVVPPGRKARASRVLPAGIVRRDGRTPALDQADQARADLLFLERVLGALEIEASEARVRLLQRDLELASQALRLINTTLSTEPWFARIVERA